LSGGAFDVSLLSIEKEIFKVKPLLATLILVVKILITD